MTHLIWSILNAIIILYFIYLIIGLIIKGKKIFKPQFKMVSILFLILGISQIISASNSEKNNNQIIISDTYNKKNNSKIKRIILEENLTFDINMIIKYSIEKNEYIPIGSSSYLNGLVSGYVWEFESINTNNYLANEKAEYKVNGILKWNLFGITIYNQTKSFNGVIQ